MQLTEFKARRERLLAQCEASSIVIVPAATDVTRSNDTEYTFRQNSDFWYLTGFNEADAWLVLSNQLADEDGEAVNSILFTLPKDKHAEIWHGRRLGAERAAQHLMVDQAYNLDEIEALLPALINGHKHIYYAYGEHRTQADELVQAALRVCKTAPKQSMLAPTHMIDPAPVIHAMRKIKSPAEIAIMRKAAAISCDAHKRAMCFVKPGVFEYQLEAEIHHEFAMRGARSPAYSTIVGSGENACILHYTENSAEIKSGDLILIDAGCELDGYAADITRTFPANGRFSEAQKTLYEIVLHAQLEAMSLLRPGNTIEQAMGACIEIIVRGLVDVNILKGEVKDLIEQEAWRPYFMHGLGHYLGLDVHDVGIYKQDGQDIPLTPGIALTVEPGLYISADSDAPKQYRGIGIRIEDDILITENGHEVLTAAVPKSIVEIEALMATKAYP